MGYLEEKQRQLDMRYLRMASIWAENSYCVRRKVGALIVKDKMIISDGYNGTPSGFENVCEDDEGHTKPYVLHAEANAITKVAKSANNCDGSTLYITAAPCIECSKLIIQAGIRRVVYSEDYRSEEGLDLLRRVGIDCEITAHHLPTHRNNGVLFDFGQKTEVLKYNYLTDAAGNRLLFNSGIEALNYMVCRGWELVQAYTSGEENSLTHYLLRIAPARLTAEQRTALLTPLQGENPKPGKKR